MICRARLNVDSGTLNFSKPPLTIHDSRPISEPQLGRFPRLRSAKPQPEQIQSVLNDHY